MHIPATKHSMLCCAALLVGGCAANESGPTGGASGGVEGGGAAALVSRDPAVGDAQPRDHQPPAIAPTPPSDLQPVDYLGLQEFIQSHRGRPLVLDVWSTSCEPCVRELPNLAKLQEDYRDRGVVCATLNIDYTGAVDTTPEAAKAAAQPVLQALGVFAHNLYSTTPDRELFQQDLFKQNRLYAPPAILVFDGSGKVVAALSEAEEGASPYEKVRLTLESLLESPSPQSAG